MEDENPFRIIPLPRGGCRDGPGIHMKNSFVRYPSPAASRHPLPVGRGVNRKFHSENYSRSVWMPDRNRPPIRRTNRFHDCESQSRSAQLTRPCLVHSVEPIKDVCRGFGLAHPIRYRQLQVRPFHPSRNLKPKSIHPRVCT